MDPLEHFIKYGLLEGRKATPDWQGNLEPPELPQGVPAISTKALSRLSPETFDGAWYLREYPDVQQAGIDPFEHFVNNGLLKGVRLHPIGKAISNPLNWLTIPGRMGNQIN